MILDDNLKYGVLLESAGWKDLVNVIEERIKYVNELLGDLGNTRERDVELKARLAEMKLLLDLPRASHSLIELYQHFMENDNAGQNKRDNTADERRRRELVGDSAARREAVSDEQW